MLEATSIVTGLSGRYATALYELAREGGAVPAAEADLTSLKSAIEASGDLRLLIKSPVFSREEQWKGLEALARRMNLSDLVRRFLGVLTSHRRLFALTAIAEDFLKLAAHERGEMTARVASAQPLSPEQLSRLGASLKSAFGRTVNIVQSREPDLIGGLIVRVGSVMVDSSIRTQLLRLEIAMREAP